MRLDKEMEKWIATLPGAQSIPEILDHAEQQGVPHFWCHWILTSRMSVPELLELADWIDKQELPVSDPVSALPRVYTEQARKFTDHEAIRGSVVVALGHALIAGLLWRTVRDFPIPG